jgi:pimeloyl-ACP methyl ester carboxylesterase
MLEQIVPLAALYASGDTAGAVDGFLTAVGGADWRSETEAAVPGGPEQAERDGATFFEVEMPALQKWPFDAERAKGITQPVMFALGSESGPTFEEGQKLVSAWIPQTREVLVPGVNHLLQVQNPALVAKAIAEFLRSHPR